MNDCLGIIITEETDNKFGTLCQHRPVYMLPFGGRYRLIDVALSNMVNHDINTVAIYTGEKIRSTMDHLGNGKPWDLNRRFKGLFIFPPLYTSNPFKKFGDLGEFKSTEAFFHQSKEEYIMLYDPAILSKVDLRKAYKTFRESKADMGMVYTEIEDKSGYFIYATKLHLEGQGKVLGMGKNLGEESTFPMHLGITFLSKELLRQLVYSSIEDGTANSLRDAVINNIDNLDIIGIEHQGHVEYIKDTGNFYRSNINLLEAPIYNEIFYTNGAILTKAKDEPSTYYGEEARVENSLVANGCKIEGEVINSILFRGVTVGKGTLVKNSILMQKTEVGEDSAVINTITDKYVTVGDDVTIAGTIHAPYIAEKNQRIIKEVSL